MKEGLLVSVGEFEELKHFGRLLNSVLKTK